MPAMSKGEATRQFIIERAAPIFNQRGYAGCAISDVMEVTGLNKGGIYRHFESKEELAAEAFDYAWRTVSATRRKGLDDIPNEVDRLKRHVANFLEATNFPGGCPVLNTAVDSDDGNPVLRARVRAAIDNWRAMIITNVESGQRAGTVRPDIEPSRVANRIIGALEGANVLSRIEKSRAPVRDALAQLDSYLETEVRATKRRARV
jgi:TetR/AcrR family transcriptional repressor of nem operon